MNSLSGSISSLRKKHVLFPLDYAFCVILEARPRCGNFMIKMHRLSSVVKEKVEAYVVSGVQEERKIELLDNLSIAVEKIQNKFENPIHNKAVKDGKEVENLCSCLEDIFQHGLKEKASQNSTKSAESLSFWTVVQKLSMKEDIQSIYRLSIIQSDVNRCRAWIRMKLKDHTIGSYIGLLTENSKVLKEFYNSNAFLRDAVKTESVRTLLQYVIASLDFYINIESPRPNFDLSSTPPVASPDPTSPSIDVSHVDFEHGEIVRRRRSSKRKTRTGSATIAPIVEADGMSSFSSGHSSGRSSHCSSTASPIAELGSDRSDAKVKLLEGTSLLRDSPSVSQRQNMEPNSEHVEERSMLKGRSSSTKKQTDSIGSSPKRTGSSGSEGSRSPCSNESLKYTGSRSPTEQLSTQTTKYGYGLVDSKAHPSSLATKNDKNESLSPRSTSTQVRGVLTQEQKSEIAAIMADLKLKSNRPLTTEKILDMIPIPEGMTADEIKHYLSDCLKDYFSLGIITTRGPGHNFQPSPLRKSLNKDSPVDSTVKVEGVTSQGKLSSELERKKSLDEFIKRGRTEPPYWSSIANDSKDVCNDSRVTKKEINETSDKIVRDFRNSTENSADGEETSCDPSTELGLENVLAEGTSTLSNSIPNWNDNSKSEVGALNGEDGSRAKRENAEHWCDAVNRPLAGNGKKDNIKPKEDETVTGGVMNVSEPLESHMTTVADTVVNSFDNENVSVIQSLVDEIEEDSMTGDDETPSGENYRNLSKETDTLKSKEERTGIDFDIDIAFDDRTNGEILEDNSTSDASNDINYVPGICEEVSVVRNSEAKPVAKIRKANTVGPGIKRASLSPKSRATRSVEREAYSKLKSKSFSSGEANERLYGFRMNSPSLPDSTTSSIDTSQGYLFDDDEYFTDSEAETCTSGENNEKENIRSLLADLGVNDDIIGMKEDHFSTPDSFMGFTTDEELENAIETCKERIKSLKINSEERKQLVKKLVQLRLKRHEQKEAPAEDIHVKKILGHLFVKEGKVPGNYLCDSCGSTIWALLHTLYKCKDCSFHCHRKCLKSIDKSCVGKKISGSVYITDITPESGLASQQFRCADCRRRLPYRDGNFQARMCNYTGQYYCSTCHWNESQVIPARVVHNWDFSPRKVSRQSKHLLNLLASKPIVSIKDLNPALFNFVEDLRDVRALREQVLKMKKYLVSCRIAIEEKLLLMLTERQHFVENAHLYTMQDLVSVNNGKLLEELSRITAAFGKHIKFDCPICQGRGFICEVCRSSDVLFPFDFNAITCKDCSSLFHRLCYQKGSCPKCKRREARKALRESSDFG